MHYGSYVGPHAVIRPFLLDQNTYDLAPPTLDARKATSGEQAGYYHRIQVTEADCTGCEVCAKICPDDALRMITQDEAEALGHKENWQFLRSRPVQEGLMKRTTVKGSQMQQPLLTFCAACLGCCQTPYVRLLTQMFADRMIIADATGCSSIWGNPYGNTPYAKRDSDGKARRGTTPSSRKTPSSASGWPRATGTAGPPRERRRAPERQRGGRGAQSPGQTEAVARPLAVGGVRRTAP